MQVIICKDPAEVAKTAAEMVAELVRRKPDCVLGFATGGTPVDTYKRLIVMHKEEGLSFANVRSFNLDEYYPIEPDHDQSYRYFMNQHLFNDIDMIHIFTKVPDGSKKPNRQAIDQVCTHYEAMIKAAGGIDLQILGIGPNGHIAFNEQGSSFASRTRLVVLDKSTIAANAPFFNNRLEDVPKRAITMGIGTILETRHAVLLATGPYKAGAIARAIEGPITASCPASAFQLHPKATFIIDEGAARRLDPDYKDYLEHARKSMEQL